MNFSARLYTESFPYIQNNNEDLIKKLCVTLPHQQLQCLLAVLGPTFEVRQQQYYMISSSRFSKQTEKLISYDKEYKLLPEK